MVKKIAVIALVAIIAVPILLGYAMNLTVVTESDYRTKDDTVDVTQLLINDKAYTYADANIYQLNSNFKVGDSPYIPQYANISFVKTSLLLYSAKINPVFSKFVNWSIYYAQATVDYTSTTQNARMTIYNDSVVAIQTIDNFVSWYYDAVNLKLYYSYYAGSNHTNLTYATYTVPNSNYGLAVTKESGTFDIVLTRPMGTPQTFADVSSGFYLAGTDNNWFIQLPNNTKSVLMTMDLDSITDPNYLIRMGYLGFINLEKTTDGLGNVTWTITDVNDPTNYKELYYDPAGSNTYQVKINTDLIGTYPNDNTKNEYDMTFEFRYLGQWPTLMGESYYYNSFSITKDVVADKSTDVTMAYISIGTLDDSIVSSPRMRMDNALFRAFEYNIIFEKTYSPASFKSNPSTKITDIQLFGSSLEFGGNTYNVSKDGEITLGSHQIPVNNLVFSSLPNENGGYDNKIGNTVVSTTPIPSTITFNGQWSANVSTQSMESFTYSHTEWNAGSFGWNGIDQNFLIVGLLTCLGVFVALGIYAKKSRSGGIIPLMIAVGCAAMVFIIML